ncbi:MAG: DUF4403 family protein [Sphingobacteriales bacterium]|nr:DUF4403 family protein [Sphingobacteriales bacterium]
MNRGYLKSISFLILVAALSACSTSKQMMALKPMPDYSSSQLVYEKQLSFINMPVEIAVKDLQNQTNKYLNGMIYEDNSFDKDNLMMKVYKENNIIISEQNGKMVMDLPLKIMGKVKYGLSSFGVDLSDTKDFYLNGIVRLNTAISLNNWQMLTHTIIQNIQWKESPSIIVAGKTIPITYLVNPAISLFRGNLSKLVDDAVNQSLDIKPYVIQALQKFSEPIKINDEYNGWFAMQPVEVYASNATVANQKITVNLGLKAYMESSIGTKPNITFDPNTIALKAVDKMPNQFNVNVAAYAPYAYASEIIQKNFAGQKFESGKRAVTVNKVDLWGKDGKMIVALNLSGSINGDFYLSGVPMYNSKTKEVYLDQVDFVLDSKSKLIKIGDWLAHDLILKKMANSCRFSIANQLAEGEKNISFYLNNYQPMKGVKVNGKLDGISPNKVILTPNAIVAMLVGTGNLAVSIDGLD